jgi:hypothetical protein
MIEGLTQLLQRVRMGLERVPGDGAQAPWIVTWEGRRYPVAQVPLADVEPACEAAELMAVAAAFEAAVKAPDRRVAGETFRAGAAGLLPKIERRRFAAAYDAVVRGRGGDEAQRLLWQPFGDELIAAYVEDQGWKFSYMTRGRFDGWDTTLGAVHAGARSNLYHRAALDWRAREVAHGDGYDAARAVLAEDVFYDRGTVGGIELAVPGRDLLMVAAMGEGLDPRRVAAAYAEAAYPIAPSIYRFRADGLHRLDPPN